MLFFCINLINFVAALLNASLFRWLIICMHSLYCRDAVAVVTRRWSGNSLMMLLRMARLRSRHRLRRTSWLCSVDVDKLCTDLCQTALRSVSHFIVITGPHHSTTCVEAACCYRPSSMVCQFVTVVSPVKTAELIEMPFRLWTLVGLRNHVLDRGPDHPVQSGNFREGHASRLVIPHGGKCARPPPTLVALLPAEDECIRHHEG